MLTLERKKFTNDHSKSKGPSPRSYHGLEKYGALVDMLHHWHSALELTCCLIVIAMSRNE